MPIAVVSEQADLDDLAAVDEHVSMQSHVLAVWMYHELIRNMAS